jgi:hypothetical protein
MRKVLNIVLFLVIAYAVAGCSGNITGEVSESTVETGDTMIVRSGDKIVKNSDDTEIIIRHIIENGTKEIEVISGSVTLIKVND